MASLIPGYEYDIFISYRQKDNKGDRWVSEFVEALRTELESTFKEEISVYFDINPHDGLLETHDVDASLKEKLKCLIFIPVISRTYCDPKSFAWEHEFKAFIEQASQDQFGLRVKLPNGNVAGRVLPVRIHDLDNEDIKTCESALGGVLRGIEFIYKSPGVNRPLRSKEENPHDNLNHTIYRDQINKVALAIKEIIVGLMTEPSEIHEEKVQLRKPISAIIAKEKLRGYDRFSGLKARKIFYGALALVILAAVIIIANPKIFRRDTFGKLVSSGDRIALAVMPFQNLTNDSTFNIWQDGIQDNLITVLSNSSDLKVRHKESVNWLIRNETSTSYASLAPSIRKIISKKLAVDIFISGTINQAGTLYRINAQLIDSHTDEVYKSFQIDGSQSELLYSVDSLCSMLMDYLVLSKLISELPPYLQLRPLTDSPEAYSCYLQGENARSKRDYPLARKMYAQALSIDSNYHHMKLLLSVTCTNQGLYEEARIWHDRAYEKIDQMPIRLRILTNSNHASFYETPIEQIKYLEQFIEIDDKFPGTYYDIGLDYNSMFQYEKAIPYFEEALQIYDRMNMKPWWIYNYIELGYAYHQTGQYKKEEKLYKKADKDFPDETSLVWREAILFLTKGETERANELLDQYREIYKENSWSESALERNLGWAYTQAGMPDKAEESFRRSVSLDSKAPFWIYYLAYHLIDQDRNVNEGLELIEKALEMSGDQYEYIFLDCKGLGLYKQGRYDEALEVLQKGWDLRRAKAGYDHKAFLHLEAARKAVVEAN